MTILDDDLKRNAASRGLCKRRKGFATDQTDIGSISISIRIPDIKVFAL